VGHPTGLAAFAGSGPFVVSSSKTPRPIPFDLAGEIETRAFPPFFVTRPEIGQYC
jgi:hypothetical protein